MSGVRKIIHVDMDCFYVAVEAKFNPRLRGRPVAVGGPPNSRSVLCTANYEARKFGVRAAISSAQAVRLCPQLILVPPDFSKYKKESEAIHKIFRDYTDLVEPLSLDEAYLDVTDSEKCSNRASLMAKEIQQRIRKETQLSASVGVAPNKFLAKVASDYKKPSGYFVIQPHEVSDFVVSLPVGYLFGVGKVTGLKMKELQIETCGDLQKWDLLQMKRQFGSWAMDLYKMCRGQDDRPVVSEWERKSFSVEETFARDLTEWPQISDKGKELFLDLQKRLQKENLENRIDHLFIKMKYYDFKSSTHENKRLNILSEENILQLLHTQWQKRSAAVRLLGVGVRLKSQAEDSSQQIELF